MLHLPPLLNAERKSYKNTDPSSVHKRSELLMHKRTPDAQQEPAIVPARNSLRALVQRSSRALVQRSPRALVQRSSRRALVQRSSRALVHSSRALLRAHRYDRSPTYGRTDRLSHTTRQATREAPTPSHTKGENSLPKAPTPSHTKGENFD